MPADKLADALAESVPGLAAEVVADLSATAASLDRLAAERPLNWQFDPTLVRGMGYYTGQVFEIIHPDMSGSVAGGGRYDKLIGRSLGHDVPACGFSIGFERIVDLLSREQSRDAIAVLVEADVPVPDAVAVAREMRELAGPGRVVETVRRSGKFGAQLKRLEAAGLHRIRAGQVRGRSHRTGRVPDAGRRAGGVGPGAPGLEYSLLTAAFRIHSRNHHVHALYVYTLRLQDFFARAHASAFALLGCTVQTVFSGLAHPLAFGSFSQYLRKRRKMQVNNGIPADQLVSARWRKSQASNPSGSCVEVAELDGGGIAVRNSRHPSGPALIYTRAEIDAFLIGVKNGEFDDLGLCRLNP